MVKVLILYSISKRPACRTARVKQNLLKQLVGNFSLYVKKDRKDKLPAWTMPHSHYIEEGSGHVEMFAFQWKEHY
jgi:hypothetical protein